MAYVPVPKDLSKIKTKVVFNLTKRQLILFTAAFIIGLPLFFFLKCTVKHFRAVCFAISGTPPCLV